MNLVYGFHFPSVRLGSNSQGEGKSKSKDHQIRKKKKKVFSPFFLKWFFMENLENTIFVRKISSLLFFSKFLWIFSLESFYQVAKESVVIKVKIVLNLQTNLRHIGSFCNFLLPCSKYTYIYTFFVPIIFMAFSILVVFIYCIFIINLF